MISSSRTLVIKSAALVIMMNSILILAFVSLFIVSADGFLQCRPESHASYATLNSARHLISYLDDRYYQLEEMEDSESATTEILFKSDYSIQFGDTDGPLPVSARGRWNLKGTEFAMILERTFATGQKGTAMGPFQYTTTRAFRGSLELVGGTLAISGQVFDATDNFGKVVTRLPKDAVGYFNMIDATDARQGSSGGQMSLAS